MSSATDMRSPARNASPRIASLATAVPAYRISQQDALALGEGLFGGRAAWFERMRGAYLNAGIDSRYSCVPLDWYAQPHGWPERAALYRDNALSLLQDAAQTALERASLIAQQVDALVLVSSTGIATPTLDALLMDRMPFRPDVIRLPIFGLGCAGGVLGLNHAARLAEVRPGSVVLLLVAELCGLTFRAGDHSKGNVIATALFGDGAAALLLATDAGGPAIRAGGEHRWPGSRDVMGWRVDPDSLGVIFSRDIPDLVRHDLPGPLDAFLARQGLTRRDIAGYACHPGGAKVVQALEAVFGLPQGALAHERDILRRYGNMSAATALFVLDRALAQGLAGLTLMTALGPGFTAGFTLLVP